MPREFGLNVSREKVTHFCFPAQKNVHNRCQWRRMPIVEGVTVACILCPIVALPSWTIVTYDRLWVQIIASPPHLVPILRSRTQGFSKGAVMFSCKKSQIILVFCQKLHRTCDTRTMNPSGCLCCLLLPPTTLPLLLLLLLLLLRSLEDVEGDPANLQKRDGSGVRDQTELGTVGRTKQKPASGACFAHLYCAMLFGRHL